MGTIDSIQGLDRFLINIGTQEEPVKVTVIKCDTKLDN